MINLYKNGKLELSLDGKKDNNTIICDKVIYNLDKKSLVREDDTYKIVLDFINKAGLIELLEHNQILPLNIDVIEIIEEKNLHRIKYKIESEEDIFNELEVIF